MELVRIRYTGGNLGTALIRCPSGNRYRYGGSRTELLVPPEDAEFLALRPDFERVSPAPPQPPAAPATPDMPAELLRGPTAEPTTAASETTVSETTVPGTTVVQELRIVTEEVAPQPSHTVTPPSPTNPQRPHHLIDVAAPGLLSFAQLQALHERGIFTLEDVLATPRTELLRIKGIGMKTVDRLYRYARGEPEFQE